MTTPPETPGDAPPPGPAGGERPSYPRRVARWLGGGASSEIVASDLIVGGGDDPDAQLIPGWHIVRAWLRVLARALRAAWMAALRWSRRRWRSRRGKALLAGLLALLLAVPTGLGFGLAAVLRGPRPSVGVTTKPRVLRVGVMAALSGDLGNIGVSVRNAVTMAVDEVNKTNAIPGWKVELVAKDDLSRPDGGSAAADAFAADPTIIGVVGPLSSTVARVALPVLNAAGLPVVSPSNSAPDLTGQDQDETTTSRTRPYSRYYRLSGTDTLEATTGADYAVKTLHHRKILVVDGGGAGGTLAEQFAAAAAADGAEIVASYQVDGNGASDTDVQAVTAGIQAIKPDLVYTTTGYLFASTLRKRLAAADITTPILGTDAMLSARYLDTAGAAAEGDLATDLAVPLSQLPTAGAFAAAYLKRWGAQGGGPEQPAGPGKDIASPTASGSLATASARAAATVGPAPVASAFAGTGPAVPVTGDEPPPVTAEQAGLIPALSAYAYDAARALLRAAATVMPGRTTVDDGARAAIAAQIGRGVFAGVTGQVAFDAYGDRRAPRSVVYRVIDGRFVPVVITS
jgi:ABC-type branched-subunit amino acid transport system substrate-binding protein